MVLLTDTCFFAMHKILHERLARVHLLHHCCVYSSQATNLFFNPADLALEFTAPVVTIWLLCKYCFADDNSSWMFALSTAIVQAWYSSGHDEWLAGDHVKHHRGCATGYFIYINYFYDDSTKETVRHLISEFQRKKTT